MSMCYQPRTTLNDPACFYGRKDELRKLFSYLNKSEPQNVSIVGQRRIGKSWLLRVVVLDKALRAQYLSEPDKYTFIYWDLQAELHLDPSSFFERLTELLFSRLPSALAEACRSEYRSDEPEDSLQAILDLLESDDHRVVLLLDEFAAITRSKAFAEEFFSHLRSVFGRPGMTCVTASYRSLGDLCHLGPDSPFFNIFVTLPLGLMCETEAEGFVTEPMGAHGIDVQKDVPREILRLAGPNPCFISQLCHDLESDAKAAGALTKAHVQARAADFQAALFDDYTYYVQRLSEDEKLMLSAIAEGNPPGNLQNKTLNSLKRLSLVREYHNTILPFSDTFGQFLKDTKGTDIFFRQAFANPDLDGPTFIRLCQIVLDASPHIPGLMREDLQAAIGTIRSRPQDAMNTCGRAVLDPLLKVVARQAAGRGYDSRYQKQTEIIETLEREAYDRDLVPKSYVAHFQTIRVCGNHGAHPEEHRDACTPTRAFLTVLETIHLAEDIYRRYPPTK